MHVCCLDFCVTQLSPKKGGVSFPKKMVFTLKEGMLKERVCFQFRASKQLKQKTRDFSFFQTPFSKYCSSVFTKNEKSPLSRKKSVRLQKHVDCFFHFESVKTLEKMDGGFFILLRKLEFPHDFRPTRFSKVFSMFPT